MLTYPQLASGAGTQYPSQKLREYRTVINHAPEGRSIRTSDTCGARTIWELEYSDLIDEEANALEAFFQATEGRLRPFTFLDPLGNLLAWSEKFDEDVWERDPLLAFDPEVYDPAGTQRGTRVRNTGSGMQVLRQRVEAPADRMYSFSLFARTATDEEIVVLRGGDRKRLVVGPAWSRLVVSGQSNETGETTAFGIELEPGGSVELFGLQAETQIGASGYRRTWSHGGVYAGARFMSDQLRIVTTGVNRHCCTVRIEHGKHL